MTGVLFPDDAAVVEIRVRKQYAAAGVQPGVAVDVREVAA